MQTRELIEDLVTRELKALCTTCAHVSTCVYYRATSKAIIQCEIFSIDQDNAGETESAQGLCTSCDLASHCKLPGRKIGVWRCNEFR